MACNCAGYNGSSSDDCITVISVRTYQAVGAFYQPAKAAFRCLLMQMTMCLGLLPVTVCLDLITAVKSFVVAFIVTSFIVTSRHRTSIHTDMYRRSVPCYIHA